MGKDVDQVQIQFEACQLAADKEESYAEFVSKDWRSPLTQYLIEGILPQKYNERYKLKRQDIFCMTKSYSRKDMMGTHYDV